VEEQTKTVMLYGTSALKPEMRLPVVIQKHDERSRFGITLPAGWYSERHQLMPNFVDVSVTESEAGGDLAWDALEYNYGMVRVATDRNHTFKNHSPETISIINIAVSTDLWDIENPKFELIDPPITPIQLGADESVTVTVRANPNPNGDPDYIAQGNYESAELSVNSAGQGAVKTLLAEFEATL
jgi:hypothetical protein